MKCNLEGREYKVFGYKGKQVRDNIHSQDVARLHVRVLESPRVAEVYNLGGGKANSCSILEAFALAEELTGKPMQWRYVDENRIGDHICYYSDLRKMQAHYPALDDHQVARADLRRRSSPAGASGAAQRMKISDYRNLRLRRQLTGRALLQN